MKKTISELISIASLGGNIIVDSNVYTTSELISLASAVGRSGGNLTLKNLNLKTSSDLRSICRVYPKNITLDLS